MTRSLAVARERWPLRTAFTISRGSRTASEVVVARVRDGEFEGRGECLPYARYGETPAAVAVAIEGLAPAVRDGMGRAELQEALPAGAARNALDCALWDLECKTTGRRAWQIARLPAPRPLATACTLSLDTPDAMRAAAARNADRPLLKLKLGGSGDVDRVAAVRDGAPEARIIVDANEAWTPEEYADLAPQLARLGVAMIEQPLRAGEDETMADLDRPVPVCADEACHDRATLDALAGRYDLINIKLDKAGGLTEALALREEARTRGFQIMVGCMIATSLSMAPGAARSGWSRLRRSGWPPVARQRPRAGTALRPSTRPSADGAAVGLTRIEAMTSASGDRLERLPAFCHAARLGSVSRAAEHKRTPEPIGACAGLRADAWTVGTHSARLACRRGAPRPPRSHRGETRRTHLADRDAGANAKIPAHRVLAGDPDVLAEELEGATTVAVAVHNTSRPSSFTYLALGGVDDARALLGSWLAGAAEGARREAVVVHGITGIRPGIAFVNLRELSATDARQSSPSPYCGRGPVPR